MKTRYEWSKEVLANWLLYYMQNPIMKPIWAPTNGAVILWLLQQLKGKE